MRYKWTTHSINLNILWPTFCKLLYKYEADFCKFQLTFVQILTNLVNLNHPAIQPADHATITAVRLSHRLTVQQSDHHGQAYHMQGKMSLWAIGHICTRNNIFTERFAFEHNQLLTAVILKHFTSSSQHLSICLTVPPFTACLSTF